MFTLDQVIESVLEALRYLENERPKNDRAKRATLYYSSSEKAILWVGADFNTSLFIPRTDQRFASRP